MSDVVPAWKFWHPLPLWKALLVGALLQLVLVVPLEMLNGGLHLGIPTWIGTGIAGGLLFPIVRWLANRENGTR